MRISITLIIVIALALFSIWLQDLFQETPIVQIKKDEHFPDYFMENFTITSMNENGQAAYILKARKLEHFADDDSAELIEPVIQFHQEKGDWNISANRARFIGDENVIYLFDEVQIERNANDQQGPLNISTDYLLIDTDSQIAETNRAAQIKTRNAELTTVGMVFDNRQGILRLLSSVRGSYDLAR